VVQSECICFPADGCSALRYPAAGRADALAARQFEPLPSDMVIRWRLARSGGWLFASLTDENCTGTLQEAGKAARIDGVPALRKPSDLPIKSWLSVSLLVLTHPLPSGSTW
jgi:hypothetical protein